MLIRRRPPRRRLGRRLGYVVRVRMARDALGMLHRSLGDSVPLVLLSPPLPQRPGAPDG